jgi:hypothetical protein
MRSFMISTHHCADDKNKKNTMDGACSSDGEGRGVTGILVWKPEGQRPLGRPRCRWEDNIQTDLQEAGCEGMEWIGLVQDRDR